MELGLYKFNFLRDRLVEHYLWGQGLVWEPQYGDYRFLATKIICILTAIDDCYDSYGSVEELQLFTDFIDRFIILHFEFIKLSMIPSLKNGFIKLYFLNVQMGYH